MKYILLLLTLLVIATTPTQAQDDNPYARFGHKGKVLKTPQERQQFMLKIPNPDATSEIALVGIAPNEGKYYLFDAANEVIQEDTLMDDELSRFLSVDPITRSYPMLTPYQYASNRPIDGVDLDGLEFFASRKGNTVTIKAVIKIKNSSQILTEAEVTAYAEAFKAEFEDRFTKRTEDNYQFVGVFEYEIVDNVDVGNDYYLELITVDTKETPGREAEGRAISIGGNSAELYIAQQDPEALKTKEVFIGPECEGCLPTIQVEFLPISKYQLRSVEDVARAAVHEIGHLLGLLHPWDYQTNGYKNVDIYRIYIDAWVQLLEGTTGTKEQKAILDNFMNTGANPQEDLKSGDGTEITDGQLKGAALNIKNRKKKE